MKIARTNYISPSKAALFYECKLRFIAESQKSDIPRTPSHPSALLGSVVHSTIENFIEIDHFTFPDIVASLQDKLSKLVERHKKQHRLIAYISDNYGIDKICTYTQIGKAARYVDRMLFEFAKDGDLPHRATSNGCMSNYVGSEKSLSSDRLQIAGKPDLTYLDNDGSLVVADFKTGKIRNDGVINQTYLFQVACYGAILKELTGKPLIKLRLIGSDDDWHTELTPDLLNQVHYFSQRVKIEAPLNVVYNSSDIATPCDSCTKCSIRPGCPKYIELMESTCESTHEFVSQDDICGNLIQMTKDNDLYTIRISDSEGQLRQVSSIPKSMVDENWEQNRKIFFFNLRSRESSARTRKPANFYLIDKATPEQSAFQAFIQTC